MEEELPTFDIEWEEIAPEELEEISNALNRVEETTRSRDAENTRQRFAEVSEQNIDQILEGAQAKTTKYATIYGIKVFKGKDILSVSIS